MLRNISIIIILIVSPVFAVRLNQNGLMLVYSLKNILESPKELVLSQKYRRSRKKYEKYLISRDINQQNMCARECPKNFSLFKSKKQLFNPQSNNHMLDFLNIDSDFEKIRARTFGFCWGHATLTRNFNYLATFRPELPIRHKNNQRLFKKYYFRIIKDIYKNKARVIPGFKNLNHLSNHPIIKKKLKKLVTKKWANLTLRMRNIKFASKILTQKLFKQEQKKMSAFINSIKQKLEQNHIPKILLSSMQQKKRIHVSLVYQLQKIDSSVYRLCLLDNDVFSDKLKNCQVYVELNLDKLTGYYTKWEKKYSHLDGSVGQIDFSPEETYEFVKSFESAHNLCVKRCLDKQ